MKNQSKSQIIIYKTESGETKIDVRFENETVWLTQKHLSELFGVTLPTINEHIKNIYREKELLESSTIRKFLIVQVEIAKKNFREYKERESKILNDDFDLVAKKYEKSYLL